MNEKKARILSTQGRKAERAIEMLNKARRALKLLRLLEKKGHSPEHYQINVTPIAGDGGAIFDGRMDFRIPANGPLLRDAIRHAEDHAKGILQELGD